MSKKKADDKTTEDQPEAPRTPKESTGPVNADKARKERRRIIAERKSHSAPKEES